VGIERKKRPQLKSELNTPQMGRIMGLGKQNKGGKEPFPEKVKEEPT